MVFISLFQEASQFALSAEIAARTAGDPVGVANELRRAIAEVDPNLPVDDVKTLSAQIATTLNSQRLAARLVAAFGALALLLAAVGLYGVITQSVVRRTGEIGVRMALGAQRHDVLWMILRDVLRLVALGFAIGIPAAIGATRLVASQVYGLSAAAGRLRSPLRWQSSRWLPWPLAGCPHGARPASIPCSRSGTSDGGGLQTSDFQTFELSLDNEGMSSAGHLRYLGTVA